eukprot:914378-Alexandrium_andersonii.AAC.1
MSVPSEGSRPEAMHPGYNLSQGHSSSSRRRPATDAHNSLRQFRAAWKCSRQLSAVSRTLSRFHAFLAGFGLRPHLSEIDQTACCRDNPKPLERTQHYLKLLNSASSSFRQSQPAKECAVCKSQYEGGRSTSSAWPPFCKPPPANP